jgi:hypothetical protein
MLMFRSPGCLSRFRKIRGKMDDDKDSDANADQDEDEEEDDSDFQGGTRQRGRGLQE